ncbi:MAG TPA: glycosyltransferase family 2 protein [Bacteroidetes bacterium]|nr:glycosyltransferase family 2 protein [Bacteroidota bacterium]
MFDLSVSIVTYNSELSLLLKTIDSVNSVSFLKIKLIVIDNFSRYSYISNLQKRIDNYLRNFKNLTFLFIKNNHNLGFGKAHNIALKQSIEENIKYHLILNPDVYFEDGVLEELYDFMEKHPEVGLVMPKVLYPDGDVQYLCKLLPTPFDLFGRRFLNFHPFNRYIEKRNEIYELRFTGYDKIMEVPYLSGCFMFLRVNVLKKVGLFDERFFMYLEDTDLSRRIYRVAKTIYYPYVHIYHGYEKGSYKNLRLLKIHIESAIKYFNKWGWFNDPERDRINKETLEKLGYKGRLEK